MRELRERLRKPTPLQQGSGGQAALRAARYAARTAPSSARHMHRGNKTKRKNGKSSGARTDTPEVSSVDEAADNGLISGVYHSFGSYPCIDHGAR
jgi:hypothetical protein